MTQPMDDLMLPLQAVLDTHIPTGVKLYGYTAEQMREYAKEAVAADRATRLAAPQPAQSAKPAQPPADLESAVINAARSAMDESYEAGNKACDIVVLNHLAAMLSLCIDDYDRNIKEQS